MSRANPNPPLYHGIVTALVTPLTEDLSLDEPALERLLERVIAGGIQGVLLLGTTGEAPSLPGEARRELLRAASRIIDGRVRTLAGVTAPCLTDTIGNAADAAEAGIDGVLLMPPYYYHIGQAELEAWCRRVIDASPLPVMLYHMPGNTKVAFAAETIAALAESPGVVGLKDSSGDTAYLRRNLAAVGPRRPDWSWLVGPDDFFVEALAWGVTGCTTVGAMLWPQAWAEVYEGHRLGHDAAAGAAQGALVERMRSLYALTPGDGFVIRAVKAALSHAGVCDNRVAPPLLPCTGDAFRRIGELLDAPDAADDNDATGTAS